ncbi:MAG: FAD-dependent oxidoreductase [Solirubrobacteraceae bacterium]|nr:FAD-dependent oxidoreductase [Solirubrobacteraceae bacterium]
MVSSSSGGPHEPQRILVAGGGIAALEAILALRARVDRDRAVITVLAPNDGVRYPPLSVLQPFDGHEPWTMPLASFAADADVELRHGHLARVDVGARTAVTSEGDEVAYDALLVAVGARPDHVVDGADPFRGVHDADRLAQALDDVVAEEEAPSPVVAFVAPAGASWSLPLYELALLTATRLRRDDPGARTVVVTSESRPLEAFGASAARTVREALERHGIALHVGRRAVRFADGAVECADGDPIRADRCVALPDLRPRPIEGLAPGADGFLRIDEHARVIGYPGVFAAGDATAGPVKQGGLACQQADAAADGILAELGHPIDPAPYRPVLRGVLVGDDAPVALRATLDDEPGALRPAEAPVRMAAWTPGKIIGHHLGPYLAARDDGPAPPA